MNVLIIGGHRGIGAAMASHIAAHSDANIITTSRDHPKQSDICASVGQIHCDITDADSIRTMSAQIGEHWQHIDWLINCAGLLHDDEHMPEKTIKTVNQQQLIKNYQTNAVGHLLVIQALEQALTAAEHAMVASISARIGSIEDNQLGGWFAYRMSKAALNMGIKTLAIEWARKHPQVKFLLLHPGTTDTDLSKPFQRNLPDGQLQTRAETAQMLFDQIEKNQQHQSKFPLFLDYQGKAIPW